VRRYTERTFLTMSTILGTVEECRREYTGKITVWTVNPYAITGNDTKAPFICQ